MKTTIIIGHRLLRDFLTAFDEYKAIEGKLYGYNVINIFDIERYAYMPTAERHQYIMKVLANVDCVHVIKGYENDAYAVEEIRFAESIGKKVIYTIPSKEDVMEAVCNVAEITQGQLLSKSRKQTLVFAREVYVMLRHELCGAGDRLINAELNRVHPNAMHLQRLFVNFDGKYNAKCIDIYRQARRALKAKRFIF